jgi:hypothetical protein
MSRYADLEHGARIVAEAIEDKLDAVLDVTQTTLKIVSNQPTREEFDDLKGEVRAIKLAVKDTNKDVQNHERRIRKLERRAA